MRLIDADKLLRTLNEKGIPFNADINDVIINAPTVEPKEGFWIYLDNDDWNYDSYRCSNCQTTITVDSEKKYDIGFTIDDMEYCPCCGAKMVEVKS